MITKSFTGASFFCSFGNYNALMFLSRSLFLSFHSFSLSRFIFLFAPSLSLFLLSDCLSLCFSNMKVWQVYHFLVFRNLQSPYVSLTPSFSLFPFLLSLSFSSFSLPLSLSLFPLSACFSLSLSLSLCLAGYVYFGSAFGKIWIKPSPLCFSLSLSPFFILFSSHLCLSLTFALSLTHSLSYTLSLSHTLFFSQIS